MKTTGKMYGMLMGILLFSSFAFVSCNNDDDGPADNDIFVGTYDGQISYDNGDGEPIYAGDGSVTVVKVGNNYNFLFSNGIPDITGVEFESDGETLINVGWTETQYIRVTGSTLQILYRENGDDVWTANCSR
ncbi:MAG: hypothetical protein WCY25_05055 [Moheibacter sp.]